MTNADKSLDLNVVACDICLKEVPKSEATIGEAVDYVVHFCGLDCYERWKNEGAKPRRQPGEPELNVQ